MESEEFQLYVPIATPFRARECTYGEYLDYIHNYSRSQMRGDHGYMFEQRDTSGNFRWSWMRKKAFEDMYKLH